MSISVGDRAEREFEVTQELIRRFAEVSGDTNPVHLDEAYAAGTRFGGTVAHGMLTAGFFSGILGTQLPGTGSIYLGQELRFLAPVRPGDRVRCEVEVTELDDRRRARFATRAWVGETLVVDGEARVLLPKETPERRAEG